MPFVTVISVFCITSKEEATTTEARSVDLPQQTEVGIERVIGFIYPLTLNFMNPYHIITEPKLFVADIYAR